MNVSPELIAWVGILLGVFTRIMLPYLRKLWAGDIKEFDFYYLWVASIGLIFSLVVTMQLAPNIMVDQEASFVQILSANYVVGLGSTSLINEILALRELTKEEVTVTPA